MGSDIRGDSRSGIVDMNFVNSTPYGLSLMVKDGGGLFFHERHHHAAACGGEFTGIAHEIDEDAFEPLLVAKHVGVSQLNGIDFKEDVFILQLQGKDILDMLQGAPPVHRRSIELEGAGFRIAHILAAFGQHIVDELHEILCMIV